jgi:hypothetical protein
MSQQELDLFLADNQFPNRTPSFFTPLTRRIPAASSGLSKPASAASYANRRTAASLTLIVPAWCQIARFQMNSVPQHNSAIEREPRFRTVPFNEFVDGVPVTALRFRRSKAADHGGLGLIEIRKAQSRFGLSGLSLPWFASHAQPPPKRLNTRMDNPIRGGGQAVYQVQT